MKVFEAISDTNIGGAGILLVTRLKHTDRKAWDTTVLLPKNSTLKERLTEHSIPMIEIDGCADRSWDWHAVSKYVTLFKKHRPELINCHGCFSARVAARLCRIPCIIYTRHCAYPLKRWQTGIPGRKGIGALQHLFCDQIIAVADAAKENLVAMGVSPCRIRVIINGVDGLPVLSQEEKDRMMARLRFPNDSIVIGICARLEPCKGHDIFLRAAEMLLRQSKRYRFLIVGEGSLRKELETYCGDHGLEPYICFTGFQSDVSPYVNLFHIQVNCSVGTETSSLALSEGMSLGIPAVVSDYGGNPHMIHEGENGLLYPVGRADLLAERIVRLTSDPVLYKTLSQGARRRFLSEFHAEQMTKKTEAFYREVAIQKGIMIPPTPL